MQEQQSDDFFIPAFLLKMLPLSETVRRETQTEDFLNGVLGWSDYLPVDEDDE
jgi:hypothetical protein